MSENARIDLEAARSQMIHQQIRAWDVLDERVLEVLGEIPREAFVPNECRSLAFADTSIPLGHGQVMMAPKIEGRLLQSLDVKSTDAIFEVGTGSGFLTACLARLGGSVRSVDIFEDFTRRARQKLDDHDIGNVRLETIDASEFAPDDPPDGRFDCIALTCSLPVYDRRFERALKVGGRLFVIVGTPPVMEARLVTRTADDQWVEESVFETVITPMINAAEPQEFVF